MNLLTEEWIPTSLDGERKRISLETLLTTDDNWELTSFRDDMELATIQLLVSLVQVCFMPKDKAELKHRVKQKLTSQEYQDGIKPFVEWFDLQHKKWPFMQNTDLKYDEKDFTTLHKLFVGLPEKTSKSGSSKAFFNDINEIETAHFGDVAVAIFQQTTNGHTLGGPHPDGLKGYMPVTTLIMDKSFRTTVWINILCLDFWNRSKTTNIDLKEKPTWVSKPENDKETSATMSLVRGLFWQPALLKLNIVNGKIIGFIKKKTKCKIKGFWVHPHTPIDIIRLKNNKLNEKPYQTLKSYKPMWAQMLSFFYSTNGLSKQEGMISATVVQQFQEYFRGKELNIAVGGYIKGDSAESLAWRRHETFSLAQGWEDRASEMETLISIGNNFEQALYFAITRCCLIAFPTDKPDSRTSPNLKQKIFEHSKSQFFKNSEFIFHSILKQNNWRDLEQFISQMKILTQKIYENTIQSLNTDVKYFRGVAEGRRELNRKIKEIINEGD